MSDIRFHYHARDAATFVGFATASTARPTPPIGTWSTEADAVVILDKCG